MTITNFSCQAQVAEYEALVQTIKKNSDKKENTFFVRYQNVCCRLRELTNALETKEMKFTELEVCEFETCHVLKRSKGSY
jgi:myosin protein heavy chain